MSFRVRFDLPENGWLFLNLVDDDSDMNFAASYVHPESVSELIACLTNVLSGNEKTSMYWELEGSKLWFDFLTENYQTTFEVRLVRDKDSSVQIKVTMNYIELCTIFWRGLRYLQTNLETFKEGWRNPFPDEAMNRFSEKLSEMREDK